MKGAAMAPLSPDRLGSSRGGEGGEKLPVEGNGGNPAPIRVVGVGFLENLSNRLPIFYYLYFLFFFYFLIFYILPIQVYLE